MVDRIHMKAPDSSVAICVYNGALFLSEQLESIAAQTHSPQEIVICDDCSTDGSREIIFRFQELHRERVTVISNPVNIGFTKNFEQTLNACSHEVIFMSDQDDVWHSDKIKTIRKIFASNPSIAGVTHDGELVDSNLSGKGNTKRSQIKRGYSSKDRTITGALSAVRRDYLRLLLPIPECVRGHDTWFTYVFSLFPNKWVHVDHCLQKIRRHNNNTSQWIVNSPNRINKFHVLRFQARTIPASNYEDRSIMNSTLTLRLSNLDSVATLFSISEIEQALKFLENERLAILHRQILVNSPHKIIRIRQALSMLLRGDYSYFNGVKSFMRDIFR
jgi:glycosyltransferase involved in cell wall biosynthesis